MFEIVFLCSGEYVARYAFPHHTSTPGGLLNWDVDCAVKNPKRSWNIIAEIMVRVERRSNGDEEVFLMDKSVIYAIWAGVTVTGLESTKEFIMRAWARCARGL